MVLTYTSGTTGMPKGSMINHRNSLYQAQMVVRYLDFRAGDEVLGFLPLAALGDVDHLGGLVDEHETERDQSVDTALRDAADQ